MCNLDRKFNIKLYADEIEKKKNFHLKFESKLKPMECEFQIEVSDINVHYDHNTEKIFLIRPESEALFLNFEHPNFNT